MTDWNGTVNFTLDVLGRITSVNDHNNKIVGYTYDAVSNQTSVTYPDNTTVYYTYDLLNRLVNVKDAENQNTAYGYDAASRLVSMDLYKPACKCYHGDGVRWRGPDLPICLRLEQDIGVGIADNQWRWQHSPERQREVLSMDKA